ncbi:unnamed protein product [Amoebophrya sp. A120]|nr:unnamed protein product [Amoebophrya sp. A120]|eukprot:GSA120T00013669001.1
MAKSIRSKIKKRLRTVKRQRVDKMVDTPRREACNNSLTKLIKGEVTRHKQVKNAFLHPNDPEAEIPQKSVKKPIDFRSETLPMSGFATKGNRRKYTEEERKELQKLAKSHPEEKILAGRGKLAYESCKVGQDSAKQVAAVQENNDSEEDAEMEESGEQEAKKDDVDTKRKPELPKKKKNARSRVQKFRQKK